ncbi:MAG: capsular biosynthesis protein, partial [Pseudomonadota bacterium]
MGDRRGSGEGRVFLLLQGPMSFFFTYLARALRAEGADVRRIHVCPGDRLFWRGPGGVSFRGRPDDWPAYIRSYIRSEGITDIVSLGDGRRWHADALPVAKELGVRVHVVEQGYIRPHFLTVEPGGTGGHTCFPRDWDDIEALASEPMEQPKFQTSFFWFSVMDVGFQLANVLTAWALYPHYR